MPDSYIRQNTLFVIAQKYLKDVNVYDYQPIITLKPSILPGRTVAVCNVR
jgi:hypothetical protein